MDRKDKRAQGKRLFLFVWVMLCVTGISYFTCHFLVGPGAQVPRMDELVSLSARGRLLVRDRARLNWFVGAGRVERVLESTNMRFLEMQSHAADMRRLLEAFSHKSMGSSPIKVSRIRDAINGGQYAEATRIWDQITTGLTHETRMRVLGPELIFDLRRKGFDLSRLMKEQEQARDSLRPMVATGLIWGDPRLMLVDVLFWAIFGVLVNLLWRASEQLRRGELSAPDQWVVYAKLVYGPILALVTVHALTLGTAGMLSFEVRVWLYPSLGLLFGFSSRGIVRLIDRVVRALLGRAPKAKKPEPAAPPVENRHEQILDFMRVMKPKTFDELRQQAKELAGALVEAKVLDRGVEA
ncbi:MAG: hypothetical protein ACE5F1_10795 [Planctomycetota bacterium]